MNVTKAFILVVFIFITFSIGRFTAPPSTVATEALMASVDYERNEKHNYRFISPLLECDSHVPGNFQEIARGKTAVASIIEAAERQGAITKASVYFRDLNNGPWFGMNEEEPFLPASLLKVPLIISYLRESESNPSILTRQIVHRGEQFRISQNVVFGEPLQQGTHSVSELIKRVIVMSDNTAMGLLADGETLPLDTMEKVYTDLGIRSPLDEEGYQIDAVGYASFFRILYNATYLSREKSEYALDLLSQTSFSDGIRAGVPESIPVSHKFGERFNSLSGEGQLHDCGIVYAPGKPYLLCIMTRGYDFKRLSPVIADISRAIYGVMD